MSKQDRVPFICGNWKMHNTIGEAVALVDKLIPLVDCPEPVPVAEAFRPGATPWRDLGKPLEGVFIDVGENGLFSRDEFETVTALGSMEFITPEEVAEYAVMEIEGRPTGRDGRRGADA